MFFIQPMRKCLKLMYNQLKYKWVFWFDKPELKTSNENWDQFLIKITSFKEIEEFWSLFNRILLPSQLQSGVNFHFFKSGIEPKWEDPCNADGGKWMLTIPKQHNLLINSIWEKTIAIIIGGQIDEIGTDSINGVVLSVRKKIIKIAIWTRHSVNKKTQLEIGKYWKKIIREDCSRKNLTIEYFPHVNFINKII
nr:eukaryotic translation initiation factor 4E [Cryptomonas sp.]